MVVKYSGGVPKTSVTVKDNKGATPPGRPPDPKNPKDPGEPNPTDWIVDSGASESTVTPGTIMGGSFTIGPVVGSRTAGGTVGTLKVTGGSMTFSVTPAGGGPEIQLTCNKPIGLGLANLLGNDQLKAVRVTFTNDPEDETGELKQKPPK